MTTVLFLTASPRELNRLNWEGEANMIQDAILHRAFGAEIRIVPRWNTAAGDLQLLLKDYRPDVVPDEDARKTLWMIYIDLLISENGEAVKLIEAHFADIVRAGFKQACLDYLDHAKTWEVTWKAMHSGAVAPGAAASTPLFVAPPFPWQFDDAFQDELADVRRRAGL